MTGPRYWTCQRRRAGIKCRTRNLRVKQKCAACGGPRPAASKPAHAKALEITYEEYIALNGGEHCGICGRGASIRRRLDRDHEHVGAGKARGLLCPRCNRALASWVTPEWLRAAAIYLERDLTHPDGHVRAVTRLGGNA